MKKLLILGGDHFTIPVVDAAIAARQKVAQKYREALSNVSGIRFFDDMPGVRHNYSYFPIFISTFSTYRGLPSVAPDNLPVATKIANEVICLPMHHELSEGEIQRVVDCIL